MTSWILWSILVLSSAKGISSKTCPEDWSTFGDEKCVKKFDEEVNWFKAKHSCIRLRSKLLEVRSPRENELLMSKKIYDSIWIGGNDLSTNKLWVWASNGQRIYPFVNWKTGNKLKPLDEEAHCLSTQGMGSVKWVPVDCWYNKGYFCETEASDETEDESEADDNPDETEDENPDKLHGQASFDGNGYIEFKQKGRSPEDGKVRFNIEFSTTQTDGILFWEGDTFGDSIGIGVWHGRILVFCNGVVYGVSCLSLFPRVDDGKAHQATIVVEKTDILLKIDDVARKEQLNGESEYHDSVYLGGLPDNNFYNQVYTWTNGRLGSGFKGCVHLFEIIYTSHSRIHGNRLMFNSPSFVIKQKDVNALEVCALPPQNEEGETGEWLKFDGRDSLELWSECFPWKALNENCKGIYMIQFSAKIKTTSTQKMFLLTQYGSEYWYFKLFVRDGLLFTEYKFRGSLTSSIVHKANLNDGEEHEILVDFRRNVFYLFVDGYRSQKYVYGLETISGLTPNVIIGGSQGSTSNFTGEIKDIYFTYYDNNDDVIERHPYKEFLAKWPSIHESNGGIPHFTPGSLNSYPTITTTKIPYVTTSTKSTKRPYITTTTKSTKIPYIPTTTKSTKRPYIPATTKSTKRPYIPATTKSTKRPYIPTTTKSTKRPYIPATTKSTKRPYITTTTKSTKIPYIPTTTKLTKRPYIPTTTKSTKRPYITTTTKSTKRPYITTTTKSTKIPYIPTTTKSTKMPYIPTTTKSTKRPYITTTTKSTKKPYIPTTTKSTKRPYIPTTTKSTKRPYIPTTTKSTKRPYIPTTTKLTKKPYPPTSTTKRTTVLQEIDNKPCNFPEAKFRGNGWVSLQHPNKMLGFVKKSHKFIIEIELTTRSSNGLIFWQGDSKSFISLGFKNGFLHLIIQFGSPSKRYELKSSNLIANGLLRKIKLVKDRKNIQMRVDSQLERAIQTTKSHELNVRRSTFYIGGTKGKISRVTQGLYDIGYYGCVHVVTIIKIGSSREMVAVIRFNEDKFIEERYGLLCEKVCYTPD